MALWALQDHQENPDAGVELALMGLEECLVKQGQRVIEDLTGWLVYLVKRDTEETLVQLVPRAHQEKMVKGETMERLD